MICGRNRVYSGRGVVGRLGRRHGGGLLKKEGTRDQRYPGRITVNIEVTTVFTHS